MQRFTELFNYTSGRTIRDIGAQNVPFCEW
jgi:hypothetical protein